MRNVVTALLSTGDLCFVWVAFFIQNRVIARSGFVFCGSRLRAQVEVSSCKSEQTRALLQIRQGTKISALLFTGLHSIPVTGRLLVSR